MIQPNYANLGGEGTTRVKTESHWKGREIWKAQETKGMKEGAMQTKKKKRGGMLLLERTFLHKKILHAKDSFLREWLDLRLSKQIMFATFQEI